MNTDDSPLVLESKASLMLKPILFVIGLMSLVALLSLI